MTLTVIQARMTSTRLPGKALIRVGNRTILEWVWHRLCKCEADIGKVIVATSAEKSDDPISRLCLRNHVPCYRGAKDDVLDRFYHAVRFHDADPVIRVTADCPLLCPELLDRMVAAYRDAGADYATVHNAPTGLVQEMLSRRALDESWAQASTPFDREHVVTWLLDGGHGYKLVSVNAGFPQAGWDLSVDTPKDLGLLRRLYEVTNGRLFDLDAGQIIQAVEADQGLLEVVRAA